MQRNMGSDSSELMVKKRACESLEVKHYLTCTYPTAPKRWVPVLQDWAGTPQLLARPGTTLLHAQAGPTNTLHVSYDTAACPVRHNSMLGPVRHNCIPRITLVNALYETVERSGRDDTVAFSVRGFCLPGPVLDICVLGTTLQYARA